MQGLYKAAVKDYIGSRVESLRFVSFGSRYKCVGSSWVLMFLAVSGIILACKRVLHVGVSENRGP